MKHLDLFTGYGGFTIACRENGIETIGFSEIDKYAIACYKYHFSEVKHYGDVRTISGREIRPDIITFGSPCQDLSIAGKRKGLEGKRSGLFFEAVRIINESKPSYFIFENVKGLFSSNNGKDFEFVLRSFADIGYDCQWQCVNAAWFLPQNRERIFVVGHIRGQRRPKIFPIGESNGIYEKENEEWHGKCSHTIRQNYERNLIQVGNVDTKGHNSLWGRVYDSNGLATNINSNGGGLGAKTGLYVVHNMLPKSSKTGKGGTGHLQKENGTAYNLDTRNTNAIEYNQRIRRLTPTECERLMGLKDGWTKYGNFDGQVKEISDSQRYKLCGNGVVIPVVSEIVKRLIMGVR